MSGSIWLKDPWQQFAQRLASDQLAHALMVVGPQGTDKRSLVAAMSKLLLCNEPAEAACGNCRSCQLFASNTHPDFFELEPPDGKHIITVDQVREVIAQLSLTTSFSARKVAVISPADAMNVNAANALLKSLEEPPGDAVLILLAHDASRLPVTIRSRCQKLVVNMPPREQAMAWLEAQGIDSNSAAEALSACGGAPLTAAQFHHESLAEPWRQVGEQLQQLLSRPDRVSAAAVSMNDLGKQQVWYWLSQYAAVAMRSGFSSAGDEQFSGIPPHRFAQLARLQQGADRNRVMSQSAVRQDLLLQDWLIEWSSLSNA